MASLFDVTSETELLALNRALVEAKFSGNVADQDIPGSVLVAGMATRVAETLGTMNPEWKQWFAIDRTRREWTAALVHAVAQRAWWRNSTPEARAVFVRAVLAPFQVDDRTADSFSKEVETVLRNGLWYSIWRTRGGSTMRLVTKRPDIAHPDEIVVMAADGETLLNRSVDEILVTDWLLENDFEFVADGVLPTST